VRVPVAANHCIVRFRALEEVLSLVPPVTPVLSSVVVSGTLVSTLGSGMFVSGTGMVMVSVGIVVGAVVGLVVGAAVVVGGVVAGALLAQLHAHKERATASPIIKMAIFFIRILLLFQITGVVFPVRPCLDRKSMPFLEQFF